MSNKNLIWSENDKQHVIGKLFKDIEETVVIWKLPNYTKMLSDPPKTEYRSPVFAFSDTCWLLKIYPSLERSEESKGYTGLFIHLVGNHSCEVSFTLAVKLMNGATEFEICGEHKFENSGGRGSTQFCLNSRLTDRKSVLLPNDTLTVKCKLKKSNSALNGVSRIGQLLNLQSDLKKMLDEKENCDVVLKLEGREIKAHKVILENRCPVFESMLGHDMIERKTGEIVIDDIEPDVFQEVLAYMYCGEVENLSAKNMCKLYVAADKYHLDELKRLCATFIAENLAVDVFCDVLAIPDTCIQAELVLLLKDFFCKNLISITDTEKWKSFDEENKEVAHQLLLSTLRANSTVLKYF